MRLGIPHMDDILQQGYEKNTGAARATRTKLVLPHLSETLSLGDDLSCPCKVWYSQNFF